MDQLIVGFADVPTGHTTVREAVALADRLGAKLHVVTATEDDSTQTLRVGSDEWMLSELSSAESTIRNFMTVLETTVPYTIGVAAGSPGDVLVSEAERIGADLIVVGNVRMQGFSRVLGSVGGSVIHNAPCSVLVVKSA